MSISFLEAIVGWLLTTRSVLYIIVNTVISVNVIFCDVRNLKQNFIVLSLLIFDNNVIHIFCIQLMLHVYICSV